MCGKREGPLNKIEINIETESKALAEKNKSTRGMLLVPIMVSFFLFAFLGQASAKTDRSESVSKSSQKEKKEKTKSKGKIVKNKKAPQKREIQSTITHKNLPIITSDIYILEKVVSSKGAINKLKDQQKVGRFITFSNFSSLSGFDGCHWFQQDYSFAQTYVKLEKKKMMEGACSKVEKMEILPPSPFSVHYQETGERLTLTSRKTKQKYIYRKNIASAN